MAATRVPLEKDSLYISTVPLIGNAFHWSLIHVDSDDTHTRHHWATITGNPKGREGYISEILSNGAYDKTDKNVVLGYFKVVDYAPLNVSALREVCQSIFPASYPTMEENRQHGITCRTWILQILSRWLAQERVDEIENKVKQRSTAQSNEYANSFLWRRPFTCVVETI